MARLLSTLIVGLLIGGVTAWLLSSRESAPSTDVVRDIVAVAKMTAVESDVHRKSGFQQLQTIEQVLALPSRFTQSEALHVLAGRTDSAGIQALIFEANRVANRQDREIALKVLFFRLTEVDPYSALALTQTPEFAASGCVSGVCQPVETIEVDPGG